MTNTFHSLLRIMDSRKDLLTEDDCKVVLKNALQRDDFTLEDYTIEPFSETKEGLIGEHFLVRIHYNDDHMKTFFMKILNGSSKVLFELAKTLFAYEKEEFFYMTLLKEYQRLGVATVFAPDCYFCKPYLIVLENLCDNGYRGTPKAEPLDLIHCKICLKTLARFHAAGIIYEELKSKENGERYSLEKEYSKYFEEMVFANDDNPASKWLKYSLEAIFELIDHVPETINKTVFKERLRERLGQLFTKQTGSDQVRNTTLHGDLWSNNFLFAYNRNGEPIKGKLIDYQILKYGPPSLDVVQFLYTNTRKAFRNKHFEELLDYYYEQLVEEFKQERLDHNEILSKEEFLYVCEEVKLPAKLQTLADRSITFLSDVTYADALSSDEKLEKFLFDDRSKHIVSSFKEHEKFRDLITEDIVELRSILFANGQC